MEQSLFRFLQENVSGVSIYYGDAPFNAKKPFIVFHLVARDVEIPIVGNSHIRSTIDVDCYHDAQDHATQLGNRVTQLLQNFKGDMADTHVTLARITNTFDSKEADTNSYVRSLTLQLNTLQFNTH